MQESCQSLDPGLLIEAMTRLGRADTGDARMGSDVGRACSAVHHGCVAQSSEPGRSGHWRSTVGQTD